MRNGPPSIGFTPASGFVSNDAGPDPLPETSARLETKEDRDALGDHFVEGAINVFFVKSLLDIDEIGRIRMGVVLASARQQKVRGRRFQRQTRRCSPTSSGTFSAMGTAKWWTTS